MPFPIFNDSQSYQNTGIAPEIFSKASSAAVLNCRQQGIPPNFFFPRGIGCLPWFAPPSDSLSGSGAVEGGQVTLAGLFLRRQHDSVGQREVAELERLQERRERHGAFLCGGV